jgi:hypothetical protein
MRLWDVCYEKTPHLATMQRNTSFFWASDEVRDDDEDNDDVGLVLDDGDFERAREGHSLVVEQDEESQPLVQTNDSDIDYGSSSQNQPAELRFQIVIWYIGAVDVCQGHVPMRFRITLFWNDNQPSPVRQARSKSVNEESGAGDPHPSSEWVMKGRQRASRIDLQGREAATFETIDVPPVSILNAVSFQVIGEPEVCMLSSRDRLMRWSCMYSAVLFQADHMRVDAFPHDKHDLKLNIGILAHRALHARWDSHVYKLALATEHDSQGSTKVPHGLVVEHVTIPDFYYDKQALSFSFVPLRYGSSKYAAKDCYLQVELPVYRLSGHYDRSIMPILALLNVVAITCLPRNFASATASTETMLSIAFVQVGIRLTIDSRLPSVGYQIKMQKVLNQCFWLLCGLVLESNLIFFLVTKRGWQIATTDQIDWAVAGLALLYTVYILILYYGGAVSHFHSKEK